MGKDSSYAISLGMGIKKLYSWGTHVPYPLGRAKVKIKDFGSCL